MVYCIKNDMNDYLQDTAGNRSSKRLWGSIILSVAIVLSIVVVITSVFLGNTLDDNVVTILQGLFFAGTALLGFGVVEGFGKAKK